MEAPVAQTEQHPRDRLARPWSQQDRTVPRIVLQPLQRFLHTEAASGILLLVASVIALVWANSLFAQSYRSLWETPLTVRAGGFVISEDLRHWVNDLLMALFFFVVGLEIKRELVHGELRELEAALLPVLCAVGGMVAPALLYLVPNGGAAGARGWGIPMATDIAFAVGILALLGSRAPTGLKVFLLTLAIVDDIGAILVIALFYSESIAAGWLAIATGTIAVIVTLQRLRVRAQAPYLLAAAVLWFVVFSSGVHATIAGVILGLLTPAWPFHTPEKVTDAIEEELDQVRRHSPGARADEGEQAALMEVSRLANESVSPLERLLARLHPWSSFVVLPLFALANAGVTLPASQLVDLVSSPVALGVILGLVVGKPVGILGVAALAVRAGLVRLPRDAGWPELLGVSLLAGVGFTVAIFIAGLAFEDSPAATDAAKIGILAASLLAGGLGTAALLARRNPAGATR